MTKTKAAPFERRSFSRAMPVAAGTASFPPRFYGAVGSAVTISGDVEEAPSDTGQTTRLAEYAVRLRYEDIPSDVLQRAKDCIADTVGTILVGAQFPWSKRTITQARRMGTGGTCPTPGPAARRAAPPPA